MQNDDSLDIAIVGMAGRYPGARDLDQFWTNLRNGRESITRLTLDELEVGRELAGEPDFVTARGVLEDADGFDAFKEAGDVFDPDLSKRLKDIYEAGDTRDPMELYVSFRGREPKTDALLRHRGLLAAE